MPKPKRNPLPWTTAAFLIDPADKRDAANGVSRFGAYLIDHKDQFKVSSYDDDVFTTDAHEFASHAFMVGYSLMSPRYIDAHRLVVAVLPHWDEQGRPAMTVKLAMPVLPDTLRMMSLSCHSWETLRNGSLAEPDDNGKRSAFATLTLRIPYGDVQLPAPRYKLGAPDWEACRDAVAVLVAHLNEALSPFLTTLNTPESRLSR